MTDRWLAESDELPENRRETNERLVRPRYPIFVVTAWTQNKYPWRRFELQTYSEASNIFEREASVLATWQSIEIAELSGPGQKPLVLRTVTPRAT